MSTLLLKAHFAISNFVGHISPLKEILGLRKEPLFYGDKANICCQRHYTMFLRPDLLAVILRGGLCIPRCYINILY
jgi:hypothetical protein